MSTECATYQHKQEQGREVRCFSTLKSSVSYIIERTQITSYYLQNEMEMKCSGMKKDNAHGLILAVTSSMHLPSKHNCWVFYSR